MVAKARLRRACVAGTIGLLAATGAARAGVEPSPGEPSPERPELPVAADALVTAVRASGDTGGRPWAVVDKAGARLLVFAADGRLVGEAPALLGLARGDDSAPEVGRLAQVGRVPPAMRTTPAGRFVAEPGRNLGGEAVVWVDYDSAFAIHRLRPAPPAERRPQRLASATPRDNRISLGCVVVDTGFFDRVVRPTLGAGRSVVYVLPETRDWRTLLDAPTLAHARRPVGG